MEEQKPILRNDITAGVQKRSFTDSRTPGGKVLQCAPTPVSVVMYMNIGVSEVLACTGAQH